MFKSCLGHLETTKGIMAETSELEEFFGAIFGEGEGFLYIATKQGIWKQKFFEWPAKSDLAIKYVLDQTPKGEVYFGPALYKKRSATREDVLGSRVFWTEFDGNAGEIPPGMPAPSITIRSSMPGHEHWYWLRDSFIEGTEELERVNHNITEFLQADISAWDASQVLRPPGTHNFKRGLAVHALGFDDSRTYSSTDFASLPEAAIIAGIELPSSLPQLDDVISRKQFKGNAYILYKKGVSVGSRSEGLMSLGFELAEQQFTNEEILVLLLDADARWGKFGGRSDQLKHLNRIVAIARNKYPLLQGDDEETLVRRFTAYGFLDLVKAEKVQLEWVWEGLLQKNGYMLTTGAPKVGKTQFSLDAGAKFVLGKDFLNRKVHQGLRIGFLSLEMGDADLKYFLANQSLGYSDEELKHLNENFIMFPVGEPVYMSRQQERDDIEELVHEFKLDGIIIDSLGSVTEGELTSEKEVKTIMDWNDQLRKRHDVFTWWIHHHRKANGDNKRPNKLSDIYGSQYITARVTTALTLWDGGSDNSILCIPNAVRLSEKPKPFSIYRDGNLHFTTDPSGITVVKEGKKGEPEEVVIAPEISNNDFSGGGISI